MLDDYIHFEDLGGHWQEMLIWVIILIAVYMLADRSCGSKNWIIPLIILLICFFNVEILPKVKLYEEYDQDRQSIRWQYLMKHLIIIIGTYFLIQYSCDSVNFYYFIPLMVVVSSYLLFVDLSNLPYTIRKMSDTEKVKFNSYLTSFNF